MTTNDLQKVFNVTTIPEYINALQAELNKLRISYDSDKDTILGNKVRFDLMNDLQQYITETKLLLNSGAEEIPG